MQETSHNDTILGRPLLHPLQEGPQGCLPAGLQQESQASEQHLQRRKENLSPSFIPSLLSFRLSWPQGDLSAPPHQMHHQVPLGDVGGSRGPALPCRGSGQVTEEVTRAAAAAATWAPCEQTAPSQESKRQQRPKAACPASFPVAVPPSPPTLPFLSSKCYFPGSPVVETLPSNTGGVYSFLGRGVKISHASWPKKTKHTHKNRSNIVTNSIKTLKMAHSGGEKSF